MGRLKADGDSVRTSGDQVTLSRRRASKGPGRIIVAAALAILSITLPSSLANAQSSIFQSGDAVMTGFSGVTVPNIAFPPGTNPLDKSLIDPEGASAQILRLRPVQPLQGQLLTPSVFQLKARIARSVMHVTPWLGATS
jgi:hypothetical protein